MLKYSQIFLSIKENLIKSTLRFCLNLVRIATIKKTNDQGWKDRWLSNLEHWMISQRIWDLMAAHSCVSLSFQKDPMPCSDLWR